MTESYGYEWSEEDLKKLYCGCTLQYYPKGKDNTSEQIVWNYREEDFPLYWFSVRRQIGSFVYEDFYVDPGLCNPETIK
jgi:hypothetical protein